MRPLFNFLALAALFDVVLSANNGTQSGRAYSACMGFHNDTTHRIEFRYEFGSSETFVRAFFANNDNVEGCYNDTVNNGSLVLTSTIMNSTSDPICGISLEADSLVANYSVFLTKSLTVIQLSDAMFQVSCDFSLPTTQEIYANESDTVFKVVGNPTEGFESIREELVRLYVIDASIDDDDSRVISQCALGSPIKLRVDLQVSSTAKGVRVISLHMQPTESVTSKANDIIVDSCAHDAPQPLGFEKSTDSSNVPDGVFWATTLPFQCVKYDGYDTLYFEAEVGFCSRDGDDACELDNCVNKPTYVGRRRRRDLSQLYNGTSNVDDKVVTSVGRHGDPALIPQSDVYIHVTIGVGNRNIPLETAGRHEHEDTYTGKPFGPPPIDPTTFLASTVTLAILLGVFTVSAVCVYSCCAPRVRRSEEKKVKGKLTPCV